MKIASIIVLLISILGFSGSVLAFSAQPTGIVSETDLDKAITFERPAPDFIIQNANEYVTGFVGKDYFNSYISLNDSYKVKYDYSVFNSTYYHDFYTVVYFYKIPREAVTKYFEVEFNLNGSVSLYRNGPTHAHKFLITKEQAIQIAKQNGMKIPQGSVNYVSGACDITKPVIRGGDEEKCVQINDWVWELSEVGVEFGTTMYIDVDTGKVLGSSFDSGIRSNNLGGGEIPRPGQPPGYSDVGISWPLIATIVILLAIAGIWFVQKKK